MCVCVVCVHVHVHVCVCVVWCACVCMYLHMLMWEGSIESPSPSPTGRWVSVPSLQLLCGGHKAWLGFDASWKTNTLPRRTAHSQWNKIHHGLLYRSMKDWSLLLILKRLDSILKGPISIIPVIPSKIDLFIKYMCMHA